MKYKIGEVTLKADDLTDGQFTGYAAVFDNVDSYGDVIRKGAFAESLAEYAADDRGIPVYWRHRMDDPYFNIGITVEASEDDRGLLVKVQLDMASAKAIYVHQLIKEKRVSQMSFAYDVLEGAWVQEEGGDGYYELRKLRIHEVSVVPVGANQETELLAVKDAVSGLKAGRTLSAKNEDKLGKAASLIGEVLAEVDESDGKAVSDEEPSKAKGEEPETANLEEPSGAKAHNDDPDAALALIALALAGVNV